MSYPIKSVWNAETGTQPTPPAGALTAQDFGLLSPGDRLVVLHPPTTSAYNLARGTVCVIISTNVDSTGLAHIRVRREDNLNIRPHQSTASLMAGRFGWAIPAEASARTNLLTTILEILT